MSEENLLKIERINIFALEIQSIDEDIDPLNIIKNINIKSFKNIENIYFRKINTKKFEIILAAKEIEIEKESYESKRPCFLITIDKKSLKYFTAPMNIKMDFREILENLSAEGDVLNITIFRLDKKEKKIKFNTEMGFKFQDESDINKFNKFFTKINNRCNEIKNAKFKVEGLSLKFESDNLKYHMGFSEEFDKKDRKKTIELSIEFDEIIDKINFAEISIEKYIKRHIKKLNEILNKLLGE